MARFDPGKLADHFTKHRADFGAPTQQHYEILADRFLSAPLSGGIKQCIRKHGDIVRYDPATEEYGVLSNQGVIRTYFKPLPCSKVSHLAVKPSCHHHLTNIQYWQTECNKA